MSDASGTGYGQCSYLRLVDDNNHVHCSFVMGKACVAPRKTVRIPRLELAGAAVSVRAADVLKNELDYERIEEFYWTDSSRVHQQRVPKISCLCSKQTAADKRLHFAVAVAICRVHIQPSR